MVKKILLLYSLLLCSVYAQQQLVIVIVIDQYAYRIFERIKSHFNYGFKTILNRSIVYQNAYFPYALPTTAPGHTSLSTGTVPAIHGIIDNNWYSNGTLVSADYDTSENSLEFSPDGLYDKGKSAKNIMVDTISDQLLLHYPDAAVMAIALKSRAAIAMAGRLGKAIWFDTKTGNFTSSKAYFDELPSWLQHVNNTLGIAQLESVTWPLAYQPNNRAYAMVHRDYTFAQQPRMVKTTTILKTPKGKDGKFEIFARTPQSNQAICTLAQHYLSLPDIRTQEKILLWLGLSSLDKVGHIYGPDSYEYIDTLYYIDRYLASLLQFLNNHYHKATINIIITADHGNMPIVQRLKRMHFGLAHYVNAKELHHNLNALVQKMVHINDSILALDLPNIWLNKSLTAEQQQQTQKIILEYLKKQSWVKNAWSFNELSKKCVEPHSYEQLFKNQLYPNRSGAIIVQIAPYCYVSKKRFGTNHSSPYNYDRHVPLIVYQSDQYRHDVIMKQVFAPQIACTIAQLFSIPKPSASLFEALPITIGERNDNKIDIE